MVGNRELTYPESLTPGEWELVLGKHNGIKQAHSSADVMGFVSTCIARTTMHAQPSVGEAMRYFRARLVGT